MSLVEKEICELGQKKQFKDLQIYVDELDEDVLKETIKNRLYSSNFPLFWDYLLQSFTYSSESHRKRIEIILIALKELEQNYSSTSISSQLVTRICTELPKFKSEDLMKLCQFCIECIQKGTATDLSWKDLLPEVLNVLSERNRVDYNHAEITGSEYKTQLITSLCMIHWSPEIITSLTSMFINLPLTKDEYSQVVNKLGEFMEKLTCQELPAFVYQLLKLCRNQNGRSIFLRLQNYFSRRVYSKVTSNVDSNSERSSMDIIGDAVDQEAIEVESTVLYHIYQCATYGYGTISNYISSLKKMIKSPEFVLHPFQISVLMTISCVSTFQDTVCEIVRCCITKHFQEEMRKTNSCWIREMVPKVCKIEEVLSQVIDISLLERELVIEGLINLAYVLLSFGPALGRDVIAEKHWHLGTNILIKILKKKRNIASCVIQRLSNHIVVGNNVSQYIDCIQILSSKMALTMLENQSCVVELMERLVQVTYPTANALLDALLPIMKLSPTMRDHLILILKKALYSRKADTRRVAVSGFLKLLKTLKISNLAALSQSSSSSFSSGQSLMTQVSLSYTGQAKSSIISNEALSLELLGVLRRCLMQQAEVRAQLYKGLYDAVCMNMELIVPTLDIISSHFNHFYVADEESLPPLEFSKITLVKDSNVVLQEPLAELIQVSCLIVAKMVESEDGCCEPSTLRFKSQLDSLCSRMTNCELIHFELDDGTDLLDVVPESQEKMIILKEVMLVYEALIGFKINIWNVNNENAGQQIKSLFDAYKRLVDFSKNLSKPKKGDKRKKGDPTEPSKKNNLQKPKAFKMPDTLLNFETLKKLLELLHRTEVDWASPAQANILKPKPDFHRFVMQINLQALQSLKNSKIEEQHKQKCFENITDIAKVLHERCISRLNDFTDFDCTTAVLASECFQTIFVIITHHYGNKLKLFLSKVGERSDSEELSSLLSPFIETHQKLLDEEDDTEEQDVEIKKRNAIILSSLSLLVSQLPEETSEVSTQVLDWFKKYCNEKQANKQIAHNFFTLYFDVHLKYKSSLSLFETVTKRLAEIVGLITQTEQAEEVHGWSVITNATAAIAVQCLCASLKTILDDIDWVVVRLGAEYAMITYPGEESTERKREYLKSKERGVCCQLCTVISVMDLLCTICVPLGPLSEGILKVVTRLFNVLNSLTKYFVVRSSKVNVAFESARFERVVRISGKNFFNSVYEFIIYVEDNQKEEEATQAKRKSVDSNILKNKVLKETKLIPKLIYEMEQYGKSIIQLSNKTKVDLARFVGTGSARDFRIKGLKEALLEVEADASTSIVEDENTRDSSNMEVDENVDSSNLSNEESPPSKRSKT
ncbi:Fanconi anemia group I protein [Agrilus planipennis]|uniref:Fanconi anemia group I protein n=1 Tax=Agrilus planipennis TaxID=224129 RepID=A0A1W4WEI3_AGRPL|nr:Fanconi anemia group I protein [Agrilus planipennis]